MKRFLTILSALVASAIFSVSVSAQGGYTVKGTIVDAIGPVIGGTVLEQGTTNGTITDMDGNYVLSVSSADAIVEFSCVGYATQSYPASQVPATVTMTDDTTFLEEVVVIGYGSVKKNDMTGSVTAIKNDELNRVLESGNDLEIVERVARDKLGYAKPNERVFVDISGK